MSTQLNTLVPVDVLAKHLAVKPTTVRTWVRSGDIPPDTYIQIGNTYRFDVPAVVDALKKREKVYIPETATEKPSVEANVVFQQSDNPDDDI